jgi:hypothetical protein
MFYLQNQHSHTLYTQQYNFYPSYSSRTVVYTVCAYVGFVNKTYILIAQNEQH